MEVDRNKYYKTSYLVLAVCLSIDFPIEIIDKSDPKEVVFYFSHSPDLDNLVEDFWRGKKSYEPIAFETQRRNLLRRINETK